MFDFDPDPLSSGAKTATARLLAVVEFCAVGGWCGGGWLGGSRLHARPHPFPAIPSPINMM